jgi:hydroxyacylglutathione hydrolase
MLLHQRFIPGLAVATYLVGDEKTGDAAVIDPTRDVDDLLDYARKNRLRVRHLIETHVHADFVSGCRELKARLDDEPDILCSGHGGPEWSPPHADRLVREGDSVALGSLRLAFIHTPGHTHEHVAVTLTDTSRSADVPWLLFTGDFLFVGDVGRPDLLGDAAKQGMARQLYQSLFEKLRPLPDFAEIFPAHGAGSLCGKALSSRRSSTLGYERRFNPALAPKAEDQWVSDLLAGMPPAPPYFRRMKRVNRDGPSILGAEPPGRRPCTVREVADTAGGAGVVLDVRSKEAFAAAHVPGAINVPLGPNLPTWAGWVVPYDRPVVLVAESSVDVAEATCALTRIGLDDLRGYLDGGMEAWETAGNPLASLGTLNVHDLRKRLSGGGLAALDVRTDGEWAAGHIDGALHVHAGLLPGRLAEVPRDRPVAVVCGSGYRATVAASVLRRAGYTDVCNVIGGMMAWKAAGLPVTPS